jgi:hypothetical protein
VNFLKHKNFYLIFLVGILMTGVVFLNAKIAFAATTPSLGTAATFGVLSSTFTSNVSNTIITGNLGYTTASGSGTFSASGSVYIGGGAGNATYQQAGLDQAAALADLNGQGCDFTFTGILHLNSDTTHGSLGVYTPGVYCSTGAMDIAGGATITLNGAGTYIFRSGGTLNTTDGSIVALSGGAYAGDVFWTAPAAATLGANSAFIGTIIDDAGITVGHSTAWTGRALDFATTVTTDTDSITVPRPTVISAATGDRDANGKIDKLTVVYSSEVDDSDYNAVAVAGYTIGLDDPSFDYPSATYCQSGANPTPTITGLPGGVFTSAPGGLSINPTTGTVILSVSTLGIYTITYTTNGFGPNSSSINMTVGNTNPSATFTYSSATYAKNGTNPLPVFGSGASAGRFSAPAGLVFKNANTGEINLAASTPGTYLVTNTIPASGSCLSDVATTTVTILPSSGTYTLVYDLLEIGTPDTGATPALAWTEANATDSSGSYLNILGAPANATDGAPPVVTVNQKGSQADPVTSGAVKFDVFFSEPIDLLTFTNADIVQNGTMGNIDISWQLQDIALDSQNFEIWALINDPASGTLEPSIAVNTVQDLAGLFNLASTSTDNTVSYDSTVPADTTVPANFTTGAVAPAGGTVVPGIWNESNTGLSVTVPIDSFDNSLEGGVITLEVGVSGGSFGSLLASSFLITNTDILAGYKTISLPASVFEDEPGFGNGIIYAFRAIIYDAANNFTVGAESADTLTVAQTATTFPSAPTALSASTLSSSQINLSWMTPADDGGSVITGYKIERESPMGGGFATLIADTNSTSTTYSNTGLSASTQYNYRVSAINALGTGPVSNEDDATTNNAPSSGGGSSTGQFSNFIIIPPGTVCPAGDLYSALTGKLCPPLVIVSHFPITLFYNNLKLLSVGEDVRRLQKFLNNHGYPVALIGFGSKGMETINFGPLTQAALIKFQEAYAKDILWPLGLNKGTGFFGPMTIKQINKIIVDEYRKLLGL